MQETTQRIAPTEATRCALEDFRRRHWQEVRSGTQTETVPRLTRQAEFKSRCESRRRKPGIASIEGNSKAAQSSELLPAYPSTTQAIPDPPASLGSRWWKSRRSLACTFPRCIVKSGATGNVMASITLLPPRNRLWRAGASRAG